jgi:hypothetical protein
VVVLGGGGGCPFRCPRCVSCSGLVASFVHRCRSSVLGVCSVSFVLHFLSCIGWIVLGFAPNSLLFNAKRVRHDHKKIEDWGEELSPHLSSKLEEEGSGRACHHPLCTALVLSRTVGPQ